MESSNSYSLPLFFLEKKILSFIYAIKLYHHNIHEIISRKSFFPFKITKFKLIKLDVEAYNLQLSREVID